MAERLKILLSGMVAGDPHQGGATWAVLQYVAGLEELGHEVLLVEPVPVERWTRPGAVASYFRVAAADRTGEPRSLGEGDGATVGLPYAELLEFARGRRPAAQHLRDAAGRAAAGGGAGARLPRPRSRLQPGLAATGAEMGFDLHTHFVTVGASGRGRRVARSRPRPRLDSRRCRRSRSPTGRGADRPDALMRSPRVGHWRSYGSIEHEGVHYGQRAHSLRRLIDLPRLSARPGSAGARDPSRTRSPTSRRSVRTAGSWSTPARWPATPARYAEFVRGSRAELGVAKSGYVDSRSGWFSDRSACYLACGRPVVAQETGFSGFVPTGEGLLSVYDRSGGRGRDRRGRVAIRICTPPRRGNSRRSTSTPKGPPASANAACRYRLTRIRTR